VDVPKLRIVPEELWLAVQERRKRAQETFHQLGGMTRTAQSRRYLFSGVLTCGECGGSMVIATGSGKRGYVKYGCHAHKHNGMCENKLMIRQDRLEEQMLAAIERRILNPATLDYVVRRCAEEVEKRLAEMERNGAITTMDSLKKQREELKVRQTRLLDVVEIGGGDLRSVMERIRQVEDEIRRLDGALAAYRPVRPEVAVNGIRDHVTASLMRLRETLAAGDVSRAKDALATHIGKLVLTPVMRDGRPVYRVSGNVSVGADTEKCRMQLVARDGIGPPTLVDST
jgi:hypothetical protein